MCRRILAIDVKALSTPTELQTMDFLKRRGGIRKRVRAFRKLQTRYMPHLRRNMTAAQRAALDGEGQRVAEEIRLFLPSSIGDAAKRNAASSEGLGGIEEELREGEALVCGTRRVSAP